MIFPMNKALALSIMVLAPTLSWGVNPHDEYYADDIFTAIEEAKKRPHHYDYSRAKRYNRSTTQSLDIPRLLNQEMGKTGIDSSAATSITAADTPVDNKQRKQHELAEETLGTNNTLPISTASPIIGNSNVHSPNITINVIAR